MNKRDILNYKLFDIAKKDPNSYFIFLDGMEFVHAEILKKNNISSERIINAGISEQQAVNLAAGLAMTGKNVYLLACAFFVVPKAYEQIKINIGYNKLNVKIWGSKSGLKDYAKGGFAHWGIDDISLLRNVPNLKIVNCFTKSELDYYLNYSVIHSGPLYLIDESCWENLDFDVDINIGKLSTIFKGKDFALIGTGVGLKKAYELFLSFKHAGFTPSLYSAHSLKPFDEQKIKDLVDKKIPIISIDEHTQGGLTDIISNIIANYGKKAWYLPLFVKEEKFNLVGGHEFLADSLIYKDNIQERVLDFVKSKKYVIRPYSKIYKFVSSTNCHITYKLFGLIPFMTSIGKNNIKKRIKRRFYLFGKIRIL